MKGRIIVFEGLDYSFKETNTTELVKYIKKNITDKVVLLSFPNYNSDSSIMVKKYLSGEFGDPASLDPYISSIFFSIDRYCTIGEGIREMYDEGYTVIIDRYVGSNQLFQSCKLNTSSELVNYLKWSYEMEFGLMKLPKPDVTIFMDMPVRVSYELMKKRNSKSGVQDKIESNRKFMEKVENNAKTISKLFNWNIVSCTDKKDRIRAKGDIFKDILKVLKY